MSRRRRGAGWVLAVLAGVLIGGAVGAAIPLGSLPEPVRMPTARRAVGGGGGL